ILKRKDRASGFHHNLGEAKTRRLLSVEAPASGFAVREAVSPRAHANHLIFSDFDGQEQTITQSSRNRQAAADRMIAEGALADGPEAVLFDETAPIYCDKSQHHDVAQTLAIGVFTLFPDRVEWIVHAAPNALGTLNGTMRVM
ncbi:carcinine hydrolase/isopenicillin-N N-acyltransferase family protein, partial [Mesorhizobium sp. M5C.F.Ca.IN.020.32.2.1]|uniref:carcinine hydrolase/isopenicillin-N N-acyltransferase family protein n=1 Tax=Mesorhizobium sp. M5C.F.Ca.IN.020.32.2.1 TaxID=2496771 RepID=UPI000FD24E2B